MIEIRKYVPEDYMIIQRRHFDSLTFTSFENPRAVSVNLSRGMAYTITNGQPIACGGVMRLWKGVGEGWVVTSDLVEKYPITFAKTVLNGMRQIIEAMDLDRVQTLVDVEHVVSQRWVEWMGFQREGVLRKYLGGRDFIRYAIIRED